jgi:predicted ATP-dependent serine protease
MARKELLGVRQPMSDEARAKIAASVRANAEKKRQELGIPGFSEKEPELVKMRNQNFDPDLFVNMTTGKEIDEFFSNDGGIPKACNYIITGGPGVGKSTVGLDVLSDLAMSGHSVLFVSAEMTRIDLFQYVQRFPKFGSIPILFLGEYADSNPKKVLEKVFSEGYDCILIDSFAEVQSTVKETLHISGNAAEKWLIDLMLSHNLGGNESGKNTTFLAIQQVTKGGVFVGSNKLKHNTTGMLELRREDNQTPHMKFTKNRRGQIGTKLFYSLSQSGDVEYHEELLDVDVEGIIDEEEREPVKVEMDPVDLQELSEVISKLKI